MRAPRIYLEAPDELVRAALKRLASHQEFERVYSWLASSLAALDEKNRTLTDGVALRQHQGASAVLAEFLDEVTRKADAAGQSANTQMGSRR